MRSLNWYWKRKLPPISEIKGGAVVYEGFTLRDLYTCRSPNRQAARDRWPWIELEAYLPWPPPTKTVVLP